MNTPMRTGLKAHRLGFTLIELIAVIVVLAILAGVAVPRYINHREDAQVAAAKAARASLASAIQNWRMNSVLEEGGEGSWPANLDDVLDAEGGEHLLNPYHDPRMPVYNIDPGGPDKMFMTNKTIESAIASRWGSIWYNPNNGRVCFRVPEQGSTQATIDLFNQVNQSNITSLRQNR